MRCPISNDSSPVSAVPWYRRFRFATKTRSNVKQGHYYILPASQPDYTIPIKRSSTSLFTFLKKYHSVLYERIPHSGHSLNS